MRRLSRHLAAGIAALIVSGLVAAGCGEEEARVEEGRAVELGPLSYNVQITRFLNPDDREDQAYLAGQPPAPGGKQYLAVFMRIENETDEPERVARNYTVEDTRENRFRPVPSESLFALDRFATVPADGELPEPDTAAASGPIKGSMILFLIPEDSTENRPLELQIASPGGESGEVELDI